MLGYSRIYSDILGYSQIYSDILGYSRIFSDDPVLPREKAEHFFAYGAREMKPQNKDCYQLIGCE